MRSRFTILGALMLLMALAVPQVGLTQDPGFEVTANNVHTKVVQYGNNQAHGWLEIYVCDGGNGPRLRGRHDHNGPVRWRVDHL